MRAKGSWTRKLKEKGVWGLLNTSNKQLRRSNYREQRLSKKDYFLLTHQQTTAPNRLQIRDFSSKSILF